MSDDFWLDVPFSGNDITVSDLVASLRDTEKNLRSILHEKEVEIEKLTNRIAELEGRLAEMADLADEQLDDLVAYIERLQVGLSIKRKELSDAG